MEPRAAAGPGGLGVTKQDIREQIWDYMESQNIADFPRPVHHRIPNFKGSHLACQSLKDLDVYAGAQEVKMDPDKPLEGARLLALQSRKTLLVPSPRLRTGLFNKITPPPGATAAVLRKCATSQGVRDFSIPVGLDSRILVDLLVVGSVAVSEKGWRIGKGEGYADLEYAMMVLMGAVSKDTPVVTVVHDCQVRDIPEDLLEDHDVSVDYILTPTRVIVTGCTRPRPAGITWSKITCEMLEKIPVLRNLRDRERQAGKDVSIQAEPSPLPAAPLSSVGRPGEDSASAATVWVGNLAPSVRVRDLKQVLRELGVAPLRLAWQGPQHSAILHYPDAAKAQQAAASLQGLHLGSHPLSVSLPQPGQQRGTAPGGQPRQ